MPSLPSSKFDKSLWGQPIRNQNVKDVIIELFVLLRWRIQLQCSRNTPRFTSVAVIQTNQLLYPEKDQVSISQSDTENAEPAMVLEAIRYHGGSLQILNQLKLPHQEEYDDVRNAEDGWHAIKEMRTRGAPAIAIVAALSLAVELQNNAISDNAEEVAAFILDKLDYLVTSRPTAVNLADAARKLTKVVESALKSSGTSGAIVSKAYCDAAAQMLIDDVSDNQGIGKYGAEWIERTAGGASVSVVTHCNTG